MILLRSNRLFLALLALLSTPAPAQFPRLVRDIYPGTAGSQPDDFQDWGGRLFFSAQTPGEGREPWISDGTAAGTQRLRDIRPGVVGSANSFQPVEFQGRHYFAANDGTHGRELWCSDGTTAGTTLFFDFEPGPGNSSPRVYVVGGQLVVQADTVAFGRELWVSDGTAAGTQLLADIRPGPGGGVSSVAIVDGVAFFPGDDGVHGFEPWIWDGAAAPAMLMDIEPGAGSGYSGSGTPFWNGDIYFAADDGSTGTELWATDRTPAGTRLVRDINPGSASSFPALARHAILASGVVLRARTAAHGEEPWFTDGTAAGTILLGDLVAGPLDSSPLIVDFLPGVALFGADSSAFGYEPFLTDGTPAGTQVVDINPGPASGSSPTNQNFHRAGDRVYFTAIGPGTGFELGVSDGTLAGTRLTRDLFPGSTTSFGPIQPIDDFVFYVLGFRGAYSDGRAAYTQWIPEEPGQVSMHIAYESLRIDDLIFFRGTDASQGAQFGQELWVMDADADGDGTVTLFDDLNASSACKCDAASAPCGNADPAAGCATSTGVGATLTASGTTLLGVDDLVLTSSSLPPNQFGVLFMGTDLGAPILLRDGLRCVGGSLNRWPVMNAGPAGSFSHGPGLAAQSQASYPAAFHLVAGQTWHFQTWFRDLAGPCALGSNLTDALSVVFTP